MGRPETPIDERRFAQGSGYVFQKKGTKYWWGCFRNIQGKWVKPFSTKETDLKKALSQARQTYYEYIGQEKVGISPDSKTFEYVGIETINDMLSTYSIPQKTLDSWTSKDKRYKQHNLLDDWQPVYEDYIFMIHKYIEYWGNKPISTITQKDIIELNNWKQSNHGKPYAVSTLNTHNAALNRVFSKACDEGWMDERDRPKLSVKKHKKSPVQIRNYFDKNQFDKLTKYSNNYFIKKAYKKRDREVRFLLHQIIIFGRWTGVRIPTEIRDIKWSDISYVKDKYGEDQLVIFVRGKNKERDISAGYYAERALTRLKNRFPHLKGKSISDLGYLDEKVFILPDGSFPSTLGNVFKKLLKKSSDWIPQSNPRAYPHGASASFIGLTPWTISL